MFTNHGPALPAPSTRIADSSASGAILPPPKWAVFDIETRKISDSVGGWGNLIAGAGGIACVCVWDSYTRWPRLFDDHCLPDAIDLLESCDLVITWNGTNFDVPLLNNVGQALFGRSFRPREHFDLKKAVIQANHSTLGTSLGLIGELTLGQTKTDSGDQVEKMVEKGEWARLMDYCSQDVRLLLQLVQYVLEYNSVIAPDGEPLPLLIPEILKKCR